LFFLLEYIDGINLREYITNKKKENLRNLNEVTFYGAILFNVLDYLQNKRILHRDLKPENLMIGKDGYLKVIDFGIAKNLNFNTNSIINSNSNSISNSIINSNSNKNSNLNLNNNNKKKDFNYSIIGTPHYMAPEVIEGKNYSFGIDYWSVGIILYEIFYGFVPFGFNCKDQMKVYQEIKEKKIFFPVNEFENEEFKNFNNLIKLLLNKNPAHRLSNFKAIKSHKFFKEFDFDGLLKFKIKNVFKPVEKVKLRDLNETDISFKNFMKNNIFFSSTYLSQYNNNICNNNNQNNGNKDFFDDILNVF
jgi:serine/threonine protein kinase